MKIYEMTKPFFVISDTHFFHANIIKYCDRPFKNALQMSRVMFNNWNKTVGKNDNIFFLGDFVLGNGRNYWQQLYSKLNGNKVFLFGNHDENYHDKEYKKIFLDEREIEVHYKGIKFNLQHHPTHILKQKKEIFYLYGHNHRTDYKDNNTSYNCTVERNNYTPILIDEIISKMNL